MLPIGGTGPQPIPAGKGREHLTMVEPFRLVSLDAAAFDWLWRLVEHRALQHQQTLNGDAHELQAQISLRASIAFREAAGTMDVPPPAARKRRLVKGPK